MVSFQSTQSPPLLAARFLSLAPPAMSSFWVCATRQHVTRIIQAWREIHPGKDIRMEDIHRLTEREDETQALVKRLKAQLRRQRFLWRCAEPEEAGLLGRQVSELEDLLHYFESDWRLLDRRTRRSIEALLRNLLDEYLAELSFHARLQQGLVA
jgi:hypothetical protein